MEEFDRLDVKAETSELSDQEQSRLKEIQLELQAHCLGKEVNATRKSRDKDIKEGDKNTAYFHAVVNQSRRKTIIHSLGGPFTKTVDILKVASNFYKIIFNKRKENASQQRVLFC